MAYVSISKPQPSKAFSPKQGRKHSPVSSRQRINVRESFEIGCGAPALSIQAKLKVGPPNDQYEQEADQVADKVMRMPDSQLLGQPNSPNAQQQLQMQSEGPVVQKMTDEDKEMVQTKPVTGIIQRMCTDCEEEETPQQMPMDEEAEMLLQPKHESGRFSPIAPDTQNGISRLRQGGGAVLPSSTRAFLEPRFGNDFSNVRIHTSPQAARLSQNINARAFTIGRDVFFNQGQFQPGTTSGMRLLAHELTHVVQQSPKTIRSSKSGQLQTKDAVSSPNIQRSTDSNHVVQRMTDSDSQKCSDSLDRAELKRLDKAVVEASKRIKRVKAPIEKLDVKTLSSGTLGQAFSTLFGLPNSSDLIQTVKSNIGKITDKFTSAQITSDKLNCDSNCRSGILAFYRPSTDQIYICPDFFPLSLEGRTITLLHEVAHTVIQDGPDVYVDNRLFGVLAGLPGQPGARNPDSLAIFISIVAKKRSLTTALKALNQHPPKDKFQGFSGSGQYLDKQEMFVRTVVAVADSVIDSAHREITQTADAFNAVGPKLPQESRVALLKLNAKGLLNSVTNAEITLGDRLKLKRLMKDLHSIQSTLNRLSEKLDKPITVNRSTPGYALELGASGLEVTLEKSPTFDIHDEFFISQALARSGTEAEKPIITVKLLLSQSIEEIGSSFRGEKLVALIDYLGRFIEDIYLSP